ITKAVAHRPKDMEDIRNIVAVQKKLNLKRIRRWVKEFAELLEAPEVYKDLDKILKTKRPLLG
ncbi:MAG: hypothetical protein Q7S00_06815, partial [bacterium]|nr:hypothetical protein [bacterium]